MLSKALFLLVFLLSSSAAHAHCSVRYSLEHSELLKKYAREIPQNLLRRGIQRVGDLDIQALDDKIQALRWGVIVQGWCEGSGESKRHSAVTFIKEGIVVVRQLVLTGAEMPNRSWTVKQEIRSPLLLHEAISAMGLPDEYYEITLALYWLAWTQTRPEDPQNNFLLPFVTDMKKRGEAVYKSEDQDRENPHRARIRDRETNQVARGTSVGGGGSGFILLYKWEALLRTESTLRLLTQLRKRSPGEFQQQLATVRYNLLRARVEDDFYEVQWETRFRWENSLAYIDVTFRHASYAEDQMLCRRVWPNAFIAEKMGIAREGTMREFILGGDYNTKLCAPIQPTACKDPSIHGCLLSRQPQKHKLLYR